MDTRSLSDVAIVVKQFAAAEKLPAAIPRGYNPDMRKPLGEVPLSNSERLCEVMQFRMTRTERADFERAAKLAGLNFSAWIRDRLIKAAKRECRKSPKD